jgi:cytochrome c peroxidase
MHPIRTTILLLASATLATPFAAHAATGPAALLAGYTAAARTTVPAFTASAERGQAFFTQRHGAEWSCSTCHTVTPSAEGRHASTNRPIAPLAPAANPKRFADEARTEKWFGRNCRDVVGRACTPAEKADVLAWLVTVR